MPQKRKPNSNKWRWLTTEQGQCKQPTCLAGPTVWNVTTQSQKHGKKA
ncbi:hypothetical protein ASZ85_02991 [Vibrio cholerae]|nr:hypothetical protein ASZ85_02991 [Vibrio cholerae]